MHFVNESALFPIMHLPRITLDLEGFLTQILRRALGLT